jgi:hypothetical protein
MCLIMNYFTILLALAFLGSPGSSVRAQNENRQSSAFFDQLTQSSSWKPVYKSKSNAWGRHWFLDGKRGRVLATKNGFELHAGGEAFNDADHVVLWTKETYQYPVMIRFNYTRLDTVSQMVNILYLLASGEGSEAYPEDLRAWADKRTVPTMSLYHDHTNAYHISFAAFDMKNTDPTQDYVRARRYLPELKGITGSMLKPDYAETGLFQTGRTYRITVVCADQNLMMEVTSLDKDSPKHYFTWDTSQAPPLTSGRIGLRHMFTRSARYEDLIIYQKIEKSR